MSKADRDRQALLQRLAREQRRALNAAARDAMMYASALAGMGFGNTQNGIIHAIGTTLPVECHIPHGLAMSFCAPFSVGFNYIANPEKYAIVADILRGDDRSGCSRILFTIP